MPTSTRKSAACCVGSTSVDSTDDTLVIFLSDHGEMMGSHHMAHKGPYMYEDVYAIPFHRPLAWAC